MIYLFKIIIDFQISFRVDIEINFGFIIPNFIIGSTIIELVKYNYSIAEYCPTFIDFTNYFQTFISMIRIINLLN